MGQDHHRARMIDVEFDQIIELQAAVCTWRDIADKFRLRKGQAHDCFTGCRRGHVLAGQQRIDLKHKRFRHTVARVSDFD